MQASHNGGGTWTTVGTINNPGELSITFNSAGGSTPDDTDYQFRLNKAGSIINTTAYSDVTIDNTAPTVSSADITTVDGSYKAAQNIDITVTYLEAVNITNTPRLVLNVVGGATRYADYLSGSGTANIVFRYAVQAGDNIADLGVSSTTVDLNTTGTIKDLAGSDATSVLPNDLTAGNAVVIDTTAPTFAASTIVVNSSVQPNTVAVTFNEPLEPVQAAINTNWTVTNNGITITYGIASAALSNGNQTVTLTLNTVAPETNTTFITNADNSGHVIVTPSAVNIKDVALNTYAAGAITEAGGTNTLDATAATVNAALARTSDTSFTVTFSEKVDKTSAETEANYTLSGTCGASTGNPSLAVLQANGVDVVLTTPDVGACHVTGASTVIATPAATITDVAGVAITSSAATNTLADTTAPTIAATFIVNNSVQPNTVTVTASEAINQAEAETTTNWTVTNNGATITYNVASAVLSGAGNDTVTLTLAPVDRADTATFITNAAIDANIKVQMEAGIHDRASVPVASAAAIVTEAGGTHTHDATSATVTAALARTSDTSFTVTFSEKVEETSAETITNYPLSGTCAAATGDALTATLQANGVDVVITTPDMAACHVTGTDTVIATPAATITDVAGVAITSSAATNTLADTTAPTIAATFVVNNQVQPNTVAVTASEAINEAEAETATNWTVTNNGGTITYNVASVVLTGGTLATLTLAPVDPADNTTFITNAAGTAHIKVQMEAGIHDVATTPVASAAAIVTGAGETLTQDATNATVTAALARTNDTTFTVTFSEKVNETTAETITNYPLSGTCAAATGDALTATLQANGVDVVITTPDMAACHVTGASTVIVTPAATITDVAGVAITPSAATNTLADTTAPTIISITIPGTPFKVGDTPTLTIVFSEAVASFTNDDLTTIEGGALSPVATADNITWTSTFTPTDPLLDTTNIITVDATGLTDTPALNPGTGTMSTANFVVDTIEPTVTITDDQTGTASDVDNTVLYTFEFSEDVQNFTTADVAVTAGGTKGDFTATDANTYTVLVTADDGSTTNISITAASAAFTDMNGNAMVGDATNAAQAVDTVNPTVLITDNEGDNVVRDANTVLITATFSEAMTSAPTVSIDVSTGADADISAVAMTPGGDATEWTYSWNVPAGHSDDTAVVTVAGSDANGNTYGGATHDDFIIDNTAPVISAGADAGEKTAVFTHTDPTSTDGTGSGLATHAWTKVSGLGTITFSSASTLNPGNISVTAGAYDNYVARLTVTDAAGNSSTDDFTFSWLPATGLVATIWSPAGSATGVAIAASTATVTFNSNITLLDATKVTIKKNSDNSSVANGAASVSGGDGTSAILNIPYSALANSTMYRINISQSAVRDGDGNTNTAAVSYFTTTAVTDITDPTVTTQTPANGAASQAITVSPTVTFSEAMDATTVNTNTVQLRALTGDAIINSVVTYDVSSHVATIDPVASLSNSTSYYVWVSGAKDVAGNTVTAYTTGADQDFGTVAASAAPTVTAQSPANGASSQAITVSPTVTFSEAMDATTVNTNTVQLRALTGDAIVNSVVTYTGTTATIDPVASLSNGTSYYVWVSGAKNAAGTTMTAYTTGADQDFGTIALGNGTLAVTGISSIETFAAVAGGWPDGDSSTADGWSWTFNITVPTTETSFAMKFANWASGSNTIAAANNIRFFSAQASANADADHPRLITVAGTDSTAITLTSDLDAATAGRQIQVTVQAQIPTGSSAGSYSTQYGVTSN